MMSGMTRRSCLGMLGGATALATVSSAAPDARGGTQSVPLIATNTYPWLTFARRAGRPFVIHSDELLASIAESGIRGYEPIITSPAEFDGLAGRLRRHGLQMRSLYVNSTLHDAAKVGQSIKDILAIAAKAKELGVQSIVTNPSPIRWGGDEDKDDRQLRRQAKALDQLGAALRRLGLTLAYHNHDAELRQGAREFHHMLTATDPANVKYCFDVHWVYRGCGNSEVAVFDTLVQYHERVVELHLRQSVGGIWTEAFSVTGDIDYNRIFAFLREQKQHPMLVLEQAVEAGSPNSLNAVEAHRRGRQNVIHAVA